MDIKSKEKQKPSKGNYSHGLSGTPFANRYSTLIQRTTNPNSHKYKSYGGRGIRNKWRSLAEFKKDMYSSFLEHAEVFGESNTYLERINNDGDYCKENCRWATAKEQANNRRSSVFYTHKNITLSQTEWEERLNITRGLIRYHINTGKTFKEILNYYNYGK